jgi:CheY-like chemotaxis protein
MARILIVEDNELNRDMLSRRLSRNGHEILTAADGLAGVDAAAAHRPDCILMDLSLPGVDGWEATQRIKADPATRAIPVIALTAHAMPEDRSEALAVGCDDYATKPIDLPDLLRKIDAVLRDASSP